MKGNFDESYYGYGISHHEQHGMNLIKMLKKMLNRFFLIRRRCEGKKVLDCCCNNNNNSRTYTHFFFCFCLNFLLIWIFCCFLLVFPFFCFLPGFAGGLPPDLDGSLQQTNVRPGAKQHTRPPGRLCSFGYPEYHQNKCFYFFIF